MATANHSGTTATGKAGAANNPGFIPEPVSGHYDEQVEQAWALSLSDIDSRGVPLLALLDVMSTLVSNFHNKTLKPLGHNYTEYAVLCTLLLHGTGLRPSVLTEMFRHPSANTTQTLKKLEQRRLIHREANPEDGRSVLVALTESGARVARELCEAEAAAASRLGRELSDRELQELRLALGKLVEIFR